MKRLEITAVARSDLAEILRYSAERWGEARAVRYLKDINASMEGLARGRFRSRPTPVKHYRYRPSGSHFIFFEEDDEVLTVVRILHESMDHRQHLPG